jgi:hypothetical protein
MYPGGSKGFYDKPKKQILRPQPVSKAVKRPVRPIKGPKPFQPIARDTGGIIGRGGKMVDDIYNTY